jgi:hypothetical protein
MMQIYEPTIDNSPEGLNRMRRTPVWNRDHEHADKYDHQLQEACYAAYALLLHLAAEQNAFINILCECIFNSWEEVIDLFGKRSAAGVGVGLVQTLCAGSLIVRKVLHDQFVRLDSGAVVCCLLFTWQKYAGNLKNNIECIFFLTYHEELSDAHQVPHMTSFQRRMFEHVRSAPAEVWLAMHPPPSLVRLSYSAASAGSQRRPRAFLGKKAGIPPGHHLAC